MKRTQDNEAIENDPLWDVLRQSPTQEASPRFADDVLRAVRTAPEPWWKRVWAPIAVVGLSTAATTAIATFMVSQMPTIPVGDPVVGYPSPAQQELADLEDMLHTEALLVASDDPSSFSDAELVALITY